MRRFWWLLSLVMIASLLLSALPGAIVWADSPQSPEQFVGKIMFRSVRDGAERLWVMNPDGSGQTVVDYEFDWLFNQALALKGKSPDGIQQAFVRWGDTGHGLWVRNADGFVWELRAAPKGDLYDPAWSPAGGLVAFTSQENDNDEIYTISVRTGALLRLTQNGGAFDKHSTWSPDGARIAFWSSRDGGRSQIYVMNADGSGQTNLSNNSHRDWDPVWIASVPPRPSAPTSVPRTPTPTAKPALALDQYVGKIMFKSDRWGDDAYYIMNPDGTGQERLGDRAAVAYYEEALSLEGRSTDGRNAWAKLGEAGMYELWVRNADGWTWKLRSAPEGIFVGSDGQLYSAPKGAFYDVAWRPNSPWIAYVSQEHDNDEIYVVNVSSGENQRLTFNGGAFDKRPSWSPEGGKVAFWSSRDDGRKQIYVMDPGGANQQNVSRNTYNDWDPVWVKIQPTRPTPVAFKPVTPTPTPNAPLPLDSYVGRVLFRSDRNGDQAVYIMNMDGSGQQRLGDPRAATFYEQAVAVDANSFDGRTAYVRYGEEGLYELWVRNADGWTWKLRTASKGVFYETSWQPGGPWIAYTSQEDDNDEIHAVSVSTSEDRRITANGGAFDKHASWSTDGQRLVFWSSRDGGRKQIYTAAPNGDNQVNLSNNGWNDWDPVVVKARPK